ncbi:hypothetical protein Nepgr_016694 [Nepenthes gracilis]|uniref:Uncharacterized protein n=1 Tax=Nepenthes gracilis TaxID=150966 RepID=A0AAD3SN52_NEPGR|nr:hypothetical protein Nepgr_016694 [Nepenthes gracilis]
MGNCQAAEAATVVIQHPGKLMVDRIYWSVSAHEVMNSNPGHYVALVITSPTAKSGNCGPPVKQLKLLRPDDTLHIGHVYRLISFEDVLKEFAAKKCVKLGKLLKEREIVGAEKKKLSGSLGPTPNLKTDQSGQAKAAHRPGSGGSSRGMMGRHHGGGGGAGQWKPALQSISEVGS